MLTKEQAGLTQDQYDALLAHVAGKALSPIHKVVLTRYAPAWKHMDSPFSTSRSQCDVISETYSGTPAISVSWIDGSNNLSTYYKTSEDVADTSWTMGETDPGESARSISTVKGSGYASVNMYWIPTAGTSVRLMADTVVSDSQWSEFNFVAGIDGQDCHFVGLTAKGNWRLGYRTGSTVTASDIYWPYQVRSFDAIRLGNYDIIAMETDLPPFDDWTTNGTKAVAVAQRVQGIVIFKFDNVNRLWSSHFILDQVDNKHDRALAHIRLTEYGGMAFATFFRDHNGEKVLCVTRSADGINWEDPIYLSEMADSSLSLSSHYPVKLVRMGKYIYLIGAGASSTKQVCYRALATDFMGAAATENTFDVTDYVINLTPATDTRRMAQMVLGNPTVNVHESGYGLSGLFRGEVTNHSLFSDLRAMRATIQLGYNIPGTGEVLSNYLYGMVSKVKETPGLDSQVSLEIQDLTALASKVGNSDSNEWFSVDVSGDNFAPIYADDSAGGSALKNTIIKTGSWTGAWSEDPKDHPTTAVPMGLVHTCADDEGLAITNLIARSMNCTVSADIDFYCKIETPVKLGTTTPDGNVRDGHEYAGIGIRMKDQHAGWWVRVTPNADQTSTYQLMLRHSSTITIKADDGTTTTETIHTDYVVTGASGTSTVDLASYDDYYTGRVIVRAKYNLISVYVLAGSLEEIFTYEAIGMGDLQFLAPVQNTTYSKPTLEDGKTEWPFTSGYCAWIAKGTGIYVDYGPDPQIETAVTVDDLTAAHIYGHGSYEYVPQSVNTNTDYTNGSLQSIQAITQTSTWNESGFKYEIGRGSIQPPGTPLGLTNVLSMRFKADVWIENGQDEKASVRVKAKIWYSDGTTNSSFVDYSEKQKWQSFEWTAENPNNKTIDGITFFFYDPISMKETTPTTFYVDNIKVMHKEAQRNIYFGNAMACDNEHVYTTEDAQKALYAYSGLHDVFADDEAVVGSSSGNVMTEVTHTGGFQIPLVIDLDMTSNYAVVYPMAVDTNYTPIKVEVNSGVITCAVKSKPSGDDVRIAAPCASAIGKLRVAVNTLSSQSVVYTQDSSLVKDWINVVVYLNDSCILSGSFPVTTTTVLGNRLFWGSGSGTMSFSRLRISVADRMAEVFSIDPGETASNPLGRLLGTASLLPVVQPDGGLRIKTITQAPKISADWTLPSTNQQTSREVDLMPPTHVRYTTAYEEVDVFSDRARAIAWSHLFEKKDDPNAITPDEQTAGRANIIAMIRRGMRTVETTGIYNPLLEFDDTVGSALGDLFLLDGTSVNITVDQNGTPNSQARYRYSGDYFDSLDPADGLDGSVDPGGRDAIITLTATSIPNESTIDLAWNGTSSNKTGFRIERSLNGIDFGLVTEVSNSTFAYIDSGLQPLTTYYYRVRAFNAGTDGPWSNIASAFTNLDFPGTPVLDNFNRATQGPPPSSNWDSTNFSVASNSMFPTITGFNMSGIGTWKNSFSGNILESYIAVIGDLLQSYVFAGESETITTLTMDIGGYRLWVSIHVNGVYDEDEVLIGATATAYLRCWDSNVIISPIYTISFTSGGSFGVRIFGEVMSIYYRPPAGLWVKIADAACRRPYGPHALRITLSGVDDGSSGWSLDNFGGGSR